MGALYMWHQVTLGLLFKVVAPIIVLGGFSYCLTGTVLSLIKAWKGGQTKCLWMHIWFVLIGIYFLLQGGQ